MAYQVRLQKVSAACECRATVEVVADPSSAPACVTRFGDFVILLLKCVKSP
jgi:hypothetical protein